MRFRAHAYLSNGLIVRDGPDDGSVYGDTPISAARRFWWRMTEQDRAICKRIVLSAWRREQHVPYPVYDGPDLTFDRRSGRLEQIEE